jgi:uncharacterized protein
MKTRNRRSTWILLRPRMAPIIPASVWFLALLALHSQATDIPRPKAKRLLQPFNYAGVELAPSSLKTEVEGVRQFYLAIPDDDLLKCFRTRAGHPAPGRDLGGWYSSDTFLVFGQIVSGLARLHAATGDRACRDKANRLITEWGKCIEPDGYFYASRKPNAPHYIYDKMLWGLLDAHLYCGNWQAVHHLSRITDWAIKNLDRKRQVNDTGTEWYTLSENLYRAYLATGDQKYREFAQVWEYHDYWDIYARGGDIFGIRPDGGRSDGYHAYSHVNTLGGAAAAYLVTGKKSYLQTVIKAADYLQREQCFATGGFGPDELLLPHDRLLERLGNTHNSFETQCGSWAVFKLAKYLISVTGDAEYGDWVERLIINGLGASLPMTSDGRVFYYSDYCLYGGAKRNTDFGWSCCTGTRPQALADCCDLIYFHDAQDLCINLFLPSSVKWKHAKHEITLVQTTRFPENDEMVLRLKLSEPTEFGLRFRVPGWLAGPMRATVNGEQAQLALPGSHWAVLHRTWKDNDQINLRLPMRVRTSSLEPKHHTPAAVLFGPVVLAFEAANPRVLGQIDVAVLDRLLTPVGNQPLHFSLSSNPEVRVRAFYLFTAGERYFMYLDPGMGRRIPYHDVRFSGKWNDAGAFRFSNEVGATAECDFEGTGVRWLGRRFNDAGQAEIMIDGKIVGNVDQFGPGRDLPFDWAYRGLSPGRHTISLKLLADKPELSTDRYLNVIGFEMLNGN